MSECPATVKVKAIDVKPYHYAIWCTVGDDPKPFANIIEHRSWSDDGEYIWFGLGTHNFHRADPDEELELVPLTPSFSQQLLAEFEAKDAERMAKRPRVDTCPTCGHKKVVDR